MAQSPAHKFGQIIGALLEEILEPELRRFCDDRRLYLDKKGMRKARSGKKVTWTDRFGNDHDLDFVIEKGGDDEKCGRPLAFIEAAWRRYTKHSRNKTQEIQGALLPISEKYAWDKPFLGAVLAGAFTEGSLNQMRSSGFEVVLFPYAAITDAFRAVGIDATFTESAPDEDFSAAIGQVKALGDEARSVLNTHLLRGSREPMDQFIRELAKTLDRSIEHVVLVPLHGTESRFAGVGDAIAFVETYDEIAQPTRVFRKFEILVRYSNGDTIEAAFTEKHRAVDFLRYVAES